MQRGHLNNSASALTGSQRTPMVKATKARNRPISKFLAAMIALSAIGAIGLSTAALRARTLSPVTRYAWGFSLVLSLIGWMREDRLARGYKVAFEYDAFAFFAWPVVMPYYLYRTRGWRGLYLAAGLYALFIVPLMIEALCVVWMEPR
jgi:hypothetical protein